MIKSGLERVSNLTEALEAQIHTSGNVDDESFLHASMAKRCKYEIAKLIQAMKEGASYGRASETTFESFSGKSNTPIEGRKNLLVDFHGDLAKILSLASSVEDTRLNIGFPDLSKTSQSLKTLNSW